MQRYYFFSEYAIPKNGGFHYYLIVGIRNMINDKVTPLTVSEIIICLFLNEIHGDTKLLYGDMKLLYGDTERKSQR